MPAPILLTAAQAAQWTGRPVGTIWRWASEGRITKYGHGKHARYRLDDLPPATEDEHGNPVPGTTPPLPEGRKAA